MEGLAAREELDHDEPERIHVGPRARGAVGRGELLRRPVARRERLRHHESGRRRRCAPHHLRDPEIEELGARSLAVGAYENEDVAGLDVAVDDAALVRDRERLGDGVQELDHGRQRSGGSALGALAPQETL